MLYITAFFALLVATVLGAIWFALTVINEIEDGEQDEL